MKKHLVTLDQVLMIDFMLQAYLLLSIVCKLIVFHLDLRCFKTIFLSGTLYLSDRVCYVLLGALYMSCRWGRGGHHVGGILSCGPLTKSPIVWGFPTYENQS